MTTWKKKPRINRVYRTLKNKHAFKADIEYKNRIKNFIQRKKFDNLILGAYKKQKPTQSEATRVGLNLELSSILNIN